MTCGYLYHLLRYLGLSDWVQDEDVGLVICFFRKASMKIGMPLCTHCCLWGHTTNFCNSTRIFCPICMGPHHEENHCSLSACCKGRPHLDPPVPPTANGAPCPHPALCRNCFKPYAANSPCCQFWQHHFDWSWIVARYSQEGSSRGPSFLRAHPFTRETGTCCKSAAALHSHGGGEEAITDEEES